jgi:hypothetical protein
MSPRFRSSRCRLFSFQTLTNPRDPADVLKASIEKSRSGWKVSWRSSPGRSYQLLQSASLNSGDWTPVGGVTIGTGALIEIEISPAHAPAFYRVQTALTAEDR